MNIFKLFYLPAILVVLTSGNIFKAQGQELQEITEIRVTTSSFVLSSESTQSIALSKAAISIYNISFCIDTNLVSPYLKSLLSVKSYTLMIFITEQATRQHIYSNFWVYNIAPEIFNKNCIRIPLSANIREVEGLEGLEVMRKGLSYRFVFTSDGPDDYFRYKISL